MKGEFVELSKGLHGTWVSSGVLAQTSYRVFYHTTNIIIIVRISGFVFFRPRVPDGNLNAGLRDERGSMLDE
jgi:hypothetical protein